MCWITELPDLIRLLPPEVRRRIDRRAMRPEADLPLRARLAGARITAGRAVGSAVATGGGLRLTLTDGTERCVDHALLATGYRVDVARYPFLTPDVLRSLRRTGGYPELTAGLESSVPGLHFLGAPAAWNFGPLMRFVAGTSFAAHALMWSIRAKRAVA